jgi:hypothetical protein
MHFVKKKKKGKNKTTKNENISKCLDVTSTQFSGNYRCGQAGTWISPHEIKSAFSLQWVAARSPARQQHNK